MLEHISGLAQIVDRWGTIIQTVHSKVSPGPKLSDETLLQRHLLQVTYLLLLFCWLSCQLALLDLCSCSFLDMSSSMSFASFLALGKYTFS